ncbi:hypothetical protein PB2503_06347 [Parvularcula bermudensis HTCC2503]|uniref:LPS export ABC transporter periplasmic protein LptC n=1 Tax=Parvularcula bermudensis (strain ATCC BAA-594 / HTCC2503 / KCTC 12087) TaxID=314260 RepID=E0THN9_PARBH|nr:LPS export ABC transporter periplasmic protein LptC [Parvularcula bermudensis]ADM09335.1 hypothetical protein PB2503_06347 [Parvularcula bermudensis HTCC2503]
MEVDAMSRDVPNGGASNSDPLSSVGRKSRRRISPRAAARHSLWVRRLRLIVPALGVGVLIAYAVSATPPTIDRAFVEEFRNIDPQSPNLRLNRPRHVGYDLEGNQVEIGAEAAERLGPDSNLITFDRPEALRRAGEGEDRVRARTGLFDSERNVLDLSDQVEVDYRWGRDTIVLSTPAASVDLNAQTVTSSNGVSGGGERGQIAADRVTAYQDEGRLLLEGNVRLRLDGDADDVGEPHP